MITATELYNMGTRTNKKEHGLKLHKAIADGCFAPGYYYDFNDEDKRMLFHCNCFLESILEEIKSPVVCEFEKELPVRNSHGRVEIRGRADVLLHSTFVPSFCAIVDWKFGEEREEYPENDLQMMSYAIGAMQYTGLDEADVYVYYAHNERVAKCHVTYDEAKNVIEQSYDIELDEWQCYNILQDIKNRPTPGEKYLFYLCEHKYRSFENMAMRTRDKDVDGVFMVNASFLAELIGSEFDKIASIKYISSSPAYNDCEQCTFFTFYLFVNFYDGRTVFLFANDFLYNLVMEDYRLKDFLICYSKYKYWREKQTFALPDYWGEISDDVFGKELEETNVLIKEDYAQ